MSRAPTMLNNEETEGIIFKSRRACVRGPKSEENTSQVCVALLCNLPQRVMVVEGWMVVGIIVAALNALPPCCCTLVVGGKISIRKSRTLQGGGVSYIQHAVRTTDDRRSVIS